MSGYSTNLAAEYYVMSMLYRKGLDAYLTLGNKKSVDILVQAEDGDIKTIDVKGLADKTSWPMDNLKIEKSNHFIVFVGFKDDGANHEINPECWIVPSGDVRKLLYHNPKGTRQLMGRSKLIKEGVKYKDCWDLIGKA